MTKMRKIEVFSAGCPLCVDALETVKGLSCPSCEIVMIDMNDIKGATRARELGVRSIPAVAINGKLAVCCVGHGINEECLKAGGLGQAVG